MGMSEDIMEIRKEQASIRADITRLTASMKDLSEAVRAGQEKQERLFRSIHPKESNSADQIEALGKAITDTKGITVRLESRLAAIEKSVNALPSSFPEPSGTDEESIVGRINTLQFICGVAICLVVLGSSWWFTCHGATYKTLTDAKDSLNMVHYNQSYGTQYSPWDYTEFVKAWNNQAQYIKNQRQAGNQ